MAYETGDTIRAIATFRDWAPEGQTGSVVDPASVTATVYDAEGGVLKTFMHGTDAELGKETVHATRTVPFYYLDYVLPDEPGNYTIEFKGVVDGKPVLVRTKIKTKFDVS